MALRAFLLAVLAVGQNVPVGEPRPRARVRTTTTKSAPTPKRWDQLLGEPRNAVLIVLGTLIVLGGGRRIRQAIRAREALARLGDESVTPENVADAVEHGRAGLMDFFRLLSEGKTEALRHAAGRALAVLWARDELIAEEEKALVRRGYQVQWNARRRYPRGLKRPIPIEAAYGLPFLSEDASGSVHPSNLEWSHAVGGSRRASTEVFSPSIGDHGHATFHLVPSDFETNGPHRLELRTRVKTVGLTERWDLDLPWVPFSFEFDPLLSVDALFALPDDTRAAAISKAIRLTSREEAGPQFFPLNETRAIRNVPRLEIDPPLRCGLAHIILVEFEGVANRFPAGELVLGEDEATSTPPRSVHLGAIGPIREMPEDAIDHPGLFRMRVHLVPDPELGWATPDVRSIWPGEITTNWLDVSVIRR